ncbi:MAG: tyrosine-type recombinase/integrase [Ruminococcus sp.]|nr:tyrosine-type recombinase/integrase [Ruminococcus sp.]
MTVKQAYDMFMAEQKMRGNSADTISYYKITLNMFIDFCGEDLDIDDLDVLLFKQYQLFLSDTKNIKRVSIRTYARAVRVFYRYLYFEDMLDIDINKLRLMKADKTVILPLSDNEVKQLLDYFGESDLNIRDKLICMLMLDCGLRRGEVVKLKFGDVDFINDTMLINGKGAKQRIVPFGTSTKQQLNKYLSIRCSEHRSSTDSFFLTKDDLPITGNTIKMLFQDLKSECGISRIYPHLLRHTFATNYIYNGGNLEVLRVLMGHSSVNITQIYIHLAAQMHIINDKFNSHLDTLI